MLDARWWGNETPSRSCRQSKSGRQAYSPVTVLTELYRLLLVSLPLVVT